MSTTTLADDVTTSPRPRAATGPGSLLGAELGRLRHRRLVGALALLGLGVLIAASVIVFFTHGRDIAGARAQAQSDFSRSVSEQQGYREQCLRDAPAADQERCGPAAVDPSMTVGSFYQDPRLRADQGLPTLAIGIGVVGALLMGLIGATAVGADWSSRAIITLLTWQPRRLRFLATRLGAIAILAVALGVAAQALGLALGSATVAIRGTWASTPPFPDSGMYVGPGPGTALIAADNFWRDLVLLQGRGIVLMVLFAVIAASIATITRSTGGFLGAALGWFVVVELAGQGLLYNYAPALSPFTLTQSAAALLTPGGINVPGRSEMVNGTMASSNIQVSNFDGFWHLGLLAVLVTVLAGVLLRRRDL